MIINGEYRDLGYESERDSDEWIQAWVNYSIEEATKRTGKE